MRPTPPPLGPGGRPRNPALDPRIHEAMLQVLGEAGLEGCALTEVARRAGVGKSSIYRRWSSKEDLVRHVLHEPVPGLLPRPGSLRAEARAMLQTVVAELGTARSLAWRRVVPSLPPEVRLAAGLPSSPVGDWAAAVEELVARAGRRGEVAPAQLPVVALALRAAMATVLERWLFQVGQVAGPDAGLVDELMAALVDVHLTRRPAPIEAAHRLR